ncbi:YeaH/YhbH family protein [Microbulbifer thermotolerans]|uniref:YeaH/YhbH family protein n=1 Tax=Microbulbifer thermotolerans TaxID=252514 RepID=UPI0022493BE7|nr:YeaH/YhbH family protein [Microbulbifer thermotolerans]MCX2778366.1 YeaH/YhbH family protein [Microbulbifer thermotolerans]MCX2784522.1 YeaH/YhbH family protein [Microbulbifer thermotolerans]MCX2796398.1 YeaH/YhbH family protein [Microbulbifer thermotolerans]MCX2804405.1 YeaH/YhbH family protein [Microbulbifer thermotolerans]
MSYIIDRRLNGKKKSTVNRQRFLRRYKAHIKKAVGEAMNSRSITDMEKGERISIPTRDIREPVFSHGSGGRVERVLPGNKEFVAGDRVPRQGQQEGGGGGGGNASDSGEGMDDFVFQISQEEFLDFMFEGLQLPNMIKRRLTGNDAFQVVRAGISNEGTPGRLNVVRSLRAANARRIALTSSKRRNLRELEIELAQEEAKDPALRDQRKLEQLRGKIEELRRRIDRVPYLDDFDLKYNLLVRQPRPRSRAVMFCLMDVSGSMNQATKDMAKRFFLLLYLFLRRSYEYTEVVFIRHHTSAKEVDEEEFFYSRETGGTIVSSALKLMRRIMRERYPASEWNIYGAQASDGDNWNDDSSTCHKILIDDIMPYVQYYSYVEITPRDHQALWEEYERVRELFPNHFAMEQIVDVSDIYPVFRQLFSQKVPA